MPRGDARRNRAESCVPNTSEPHMVLCSSGYAMQQNTRCYKRMVSYRTHSLSSSWGGAGPPSPTGSILLTDGTREANSDPRKLPTVGLANVRHVGVGAGTPLKHWLLDVRRGRNGPGGLVTGHEARGGELAVDGSVVALCCGINQEQRQRKSMHTMQLRIMPCHGPPGKANKQNKTKRLEGDAPKAGMG